MQMVGVYCEKTAAYEYVKWENETKRKERINGRRTQRRWDEKRPVCGKAEIATEVSRTDAAGTYRRREKRGVEKSISRVQ